jgi:hypothetical protein
MKSMTIYLLLLCSAMAGLPSQASAAQTRGIGASEKSALAALSQPALLLQSAGEVDLIVEPEHRRWHRGYGYGIGIGGVILTAVIVTLIIVGTRPPNPR